MRPSRRSRSARSSARQRIAITSEAAVISKRASRSVPRGDWPPSSPRPMRTRRRLRSLRSSTRGQVTRAGSMPSALPQWRWLSSSAASRLWAAVTAWRSPLKWRLMASMGTTWAWPPPAAPPFMPKTGPSEGSRRQAMADTPSRERASTSPTQVVVLPSPAGVGVIAETSTSRPRGRPRSRSSSPRESLARWWPKGTSSSAARPRRASASPRIGSRCARRAISRSESGLGSRGGWVMARPPAVGGAPAQPS